MSVGEIVFIGDEGKISRPEGNFKRAFELLGIAEKVRVLDQPVTFEKVLVPELGYQRNRYFSAEYLHLFNVMAENSWFCPDAGENYSRPVFLSRDSWMRNERKDDPTANYEFVENFFEKNDFRIVYPERISLDELIYLFRHADFTVGTEGSVVHNFLFIEDQANAIVLDKQAANNEIQMDIHRMRRLGDNIVDANLSFFPVEIAGRGPFLFYPSDYFLKFAEDYHYSLQIDKEKLFCGMWDYIKLWRRFYLNNREKSRWLGPRKLWYIEEAIEESLAEIEHLDMDRELKNELLAIAEEGKRLLMPQ